MKSEQSLFFRRKCSALEIQLLLTKNDNRNILVVEVKINKKKEEANKQEKERASFGF